MLIGTVKTPIFRILIFFTFPSVSRLCQSAAGDYYHANRKLHYT